jgi:lysophospholipase L1-like esterase
MNLTLPLPRRLFARLALLAALAAAAPGARAELAVKSGDTIAFMGDSITQGGNNKGGYVSLVMSALKSQGLEVKHIPAGKSGHKSTDMLARLDADVISKKPQWMTLSCGVNDVWHFKLVLGDRVFQGVGIEDYKKNIRAIIEKCQAADIKVMVLTSTMIGEDQSKELNQMMVPYNDFLREIAKEKGCLLADLNADMQAALKKFPDVPGKPKTFGKYFYGGELLNKLTTDGCHMNAEGNKMMARGVLRAFGMSDAQLAEAGKSW